MWSYSSDVNAYVIRFTRTRCTEVSTEIAPGVIVDYDDQARIVSLEILQPGPPSNGCASVVLEILETDGEWLRAKIGHGARDQTKEMIVTKDADKMYKIEEGANGDITAISIANPMSSLTDKWSTKGNKWDWLAEFKFK